MSEAYALAESLGLEPILEADGVPLARPPVGTLRRRPPRLDEHGDEIRAWLREPERVASERMLARQHLRGSARPGPSGLPAMARRPGGAAALASAVGNRNFCALIARDEKKTAKKASKLDYAKAELANAALRRAAVRRPRSVPWARASKLAGVAPDLDALWKADDQPASPTPSPRCR